MKIGQEITFDKGFELQRIVSGDMVSTKAGDKAVVGINGTIKITTGKARGLIISKDFFNEEVKGYDHRNISKMILSRLNNVFYLENFMEDEDIEAKSIIEEIEDVLMDFM